MKRLLTYLIMTIAMLAVASPAAMALSAKEIIDKADAALRNAGSVTASFAFEGQDLGGAGTIVLSGSKFNMTVGNVSYWYDGKTLWSYFATGGEVYVSEPTADELAEINPISVLDAISRDCTYTSLKAPKGYHTVKCSAKKTSVPFTTMTVTVNASTFMPSSIKMTSRRAGTITLELDNVNVGAKVAASTFTFTKSKAPGAEVIDMR